MTSKEALKNFCNMCEKKILEDKKLCPWRSISNDYCDEYENIKQYLDKLEEQVSTLDNSVNNLLLDLDIAKEENNKLKKLIKFLGEQLGLVFDLDNYDLITCLGTIAIINADINTIKDYYLIFCGLSPNEIWIDDATPTIKSTTDQVNHPSHYTDGKIEVIDFIEDKKLGFHLGNAVKYIARAGKKDPNKTIEDIKKAIWYLERYLEVLENERNTSKI